MKNDSTSREASDQTDLQPTPTPAEPGALPQFVKVEANLLRLPLFALHTKGLRTLDGIECTGTTSRDGQTQEFTFRVTRNTASLYPGPLSRKVHFALISVATEPGIPLSNPITWSWRDLCRRMDISYAGQTTIRQLKSAVRSTHGVVIHTKSALYSRADGQLLPSRERGHHLYEDYVFVNEPLPDGRLADVNHVWFADWYLANLNALFTAPLDYRLWIWLEKKSPIASRLYEFLLVNFYSGTPVLRINYPNLAQFLPIQIHPYISLAERQLAPALKLLGQAEVIRGATWATSRHGTPQLLLHRGDRLTPPGERGQTAQVLVAEELTGGTVAVRELRNVKPPEWGMVAEFYRFWVNDESHNPGPKELEQARHYLAEYGPRKAKAVVAKAMRRMKKQWPEAKTFGALAQYVPEAAVDVDGEHRVAERRRAEQRRQREDEERQDRERAEERSFVTMWLPAWEAATENERESVKAAVVEANPYLGRSPFRTSSFATVLYLHEFARRAGGAEV